MQIKVGCCGFAEGMENYFKEFKLVEIQQTFYRLPKLETVRKWREKAPKDFEFVVKTHQGVTHPITSPTWKRSGIKFTGKEKYGFLQPSKEVFDSWNKTLEICKILDSKICLIQLPASFKESEENIKNAEKFFSKINRNSILIALELRGWSKEGFKNICKKFDLISCVDLFKDNPLWFSKRKIAYFRLHGSYEKGRINYNYKYTHKDLIELKKKIGSLPKINEVYLLFNNLWMYDSAKEFIKISRNN